jgi:hypothetical protein
MKSLIPFLQEVLIDLGTWCHTSTTRDFKTVVSRVEHEGLSFLTITLAKFGKDFQKSLDQGFVDPSQFGSFHRAGGLPRFLGGFLDRVFDRSSGRLLDKPDIVSIWAVRQFTLMWAKIEIECSEERTRLAMDRFIQCEYEVRVTDSILSEKDKIEFQRLGRVLWSDLFSYVDARVYYGEIVPNHGPGATADKLRGNAKWSQTVWPDRLESVFPFGEHIFPSRADALNEVASVNFVEPGKELPVKVTPVPKTLETPRIIAIEPTAMQYMQQGLKDEISSFVERDDILSRLISTESQVPNQELAFSGSLNGTIATLDLSEASDRVSNQHVRMLLQNHPHLLEAVDATRSRKADVPGHGVVRLAKFASMGSALCFPFESIVFTTLVFLGIERALNRRLSKKDIESYLGSVRVYGDDICLPVDYVESVVNTLETFGFKVNSDKSFWTGKFRESCGKDYYDGEDVSITRLRSELPTRRKHVREIVSTISTRNQLYLAGLWRSAAYLDRIIEGLIPFPDVEATSPLLGRLTSLPVVAGKVKWDPHHHVPLVKGMVVRSVLPPSRATDRGALLKCLLSNRGLPATDVRHLERAGRPRAVDIEPRWAPPF